jgi:cytochrome c-type biogenesis protein CcmH
VGAVAAAEPMSDREQRRVHDISAQLRCVVCQALSVADSPSATAQQMRALVLEQVRAGKSDEAILAYFVSRYGEWVLLAPPRQGFNLLAWWLPFVGIAVGVLAVVLAARKWVANGRALRAAEGLSRSDRERLADELTRLGR